MLTGPVGSGKSFVAASVSRQLKKTSATNKVATFYCKDDNVHNKAPVVLRGLLLQLASQVPDVCAHLTSLWTEKVENRKDPGTELFRTIESLKEIFKKIVSFICPDDVNVYLVVDGLDGLDESLVLTTMSSGKSMPRESSSKQCRSPTRH